MENVEAVGKHDKAAARCRPERGDHGFDLAGTVHGMGGELYPPCSRAAFGCLTFPGSTPSRRLTIRQLSRLAPGPPSGEYAITGMLCREHASAFQAAIAAISGLIPMMFMTRVRL